MDKQAMLRLLKHAIQCSGGMLAIVDAENASCDTALTQCFGKCEQTFLQTAILLTDAVCMKSNALFACCTQRVGCVPGVLLLVQIIIWQFSKKAVVLKMSVQTCRAEL